MNKSIASDVTSSPSPHLSRQEMNRAALAAYLKAGGPSCMPVKETFHRLMTAVPAGGGEDALSAIRGVVEVMSELAALPAGDRSVLSGNLPIEDVLGLTGMEALAVRLRKQRDIFRSSKVLEKAWLAMEAQEEVARLAREREEGARVAAINAEEIRRVETLTAMLAMARTGVRLHVTSQGRAIAWPASLMTPADVELLNERNALLAELILEEWTR